MIDGLKGEDKKKKQKKTDQNLCVLKFCQHQRRHHITTMQIKMCITDATSDHHTSLLPAILTVAAAVVHLFVCLYRYAQER